MIRLNVNVQNAVRPYGSQASQYTEADKQNYQELNANEVDGTELVAQKRLDGAFDTTDHKKTHFTTALCITKERKKSAL